MAANALGYTSSSRSASFGSAFKSLFELFRYRRLIGQLVWRDAFGRYRGSYLGVVWSFLTPLLLLTIYGIVFGLIFKSRFTGHPSEGPADYALALFAGLIIFNLFADALTRSSFLILSQPNFVTKVVFPLEVLPLTLVLSGVIHMIISLIPLCIGLLVLRGSIPWTILVWPALVPPVVFLSLGVAWLISALGVFFRDMNSVVLLLMTIMMYISAIFYPIELVRKRMPLMLPYVEYNPLAFLIEQSRNMAVWHLLPDWPTYFIVTGICFVLMLLGYLFFARVKHAFADVM